MTETQKRIKAYKEALPGLRERVVAVALLLAMSVAMMTSASFAWLTISRSPEVTGVNTNIAANGNLEIALATGDGKTPPGESKVGDSSAAEGQSVPKANITWGNLINLSDPSYGLDNLALRPAQLNTSALLVSPLYGAQYGIDGRITQLDSSFRYTSWTPADGDTPAHFAVSEETGVRAISSTKIEALGAAATYTKMLEAAKNTNLAAANMYVNLGNSDKYMPSLATMMGLYMTARMNPSNATLSNPDCSIEDIQNLRDMYGAFEDCFDKEAEAIANLLNLQLFLKHGDGNYEPYTWESVYTTTEADLTAKGLKLANLNQFNKDHNTIVSDLEKLRTIASSGSGLKWKDSGLNGIVNNLVDVGKCTIGADNTPISSIGASNAMGYLSGTQEARITNGILYRFEERTGGYIQVKNLGISATVERSGITIPATVKANIQTTAPRDYNLFNNDLAYTEGLNTGNYQGGTPVAKETFGLALDLWVRTNAEDSYLTLEGNVLTETEEDVPVLGTDSGGNTVELYTLTRTEEVENDDGTTESVSYSIDVYKKETKESDGSVSTVYYNAETHSVEEVKDTDKLLQKLTDVITVVGYEGENRVWNGTDYEGMLSTDATTQGSGSCYVYYADSPEDQARSLKLLEAFNVAFVDDKGKLLATAFMDTENHFADNGRVTVPLVLSSSNSINLGEDANGIVTYAIAALEKNVATRLTAIVYLDGTKLTNQEVLAASEIQGQLNIQFGNSLALDPIENEELQNKERKVTASVDKTKFDYDTAVGDMITNVTVHVDGDAPNKVTAFFIRAVSSTQGSRESVMEFTKNADGDWVAAYEFTAPGKYVLRTVQLDGVEYTLETPPEVEVEGFAVKSLSCEQGNPVRILTAANSGTVNLTLQFATDDESKMPTTVQGRYLRNEDGSAVNVDFTYNATKKAWSGSATFLNSGTYTMQYLVLDGEYKELETGMWQTASVTLGMRVAVYTTSPYTFKYVPSEMAANEKLLGMQVKIMDNTGEEMLGLSGVKLTYGMKGSGIKTMDTDLKWDGNYYVGELTTTGPGIWQFSNVTVAGNTLTTATTSPTFTVLSPEPPEYAGHSTVAYQYKPNMDATMNAQITHSSAAQVQAYIIKDGATEGTWVTGTMGGTNDATAVTQWNFKVPGDANGYQDGNWKLTTLRLWDVFAADGTPYTEDAPLEIDVSNENNVTKVVNRVNVTFATDKSQNFGKTGDEVTAQFMTEHTFNGLSVDIKDFAGNTVPGVSDVQLTFTYKNGTSGTYGKYTSSDLTNATKGATITVALDSNSGTRYSQSTDATILYAGEYYTGLVFKINGAWYAYGDVNGDGKTTTARIGGIDVTEQTMPDKAPVFTVSSKAPVVKVTGTDPAPGTVKRIYSVSEPASTDQAIQGDFFKYSNYSATVYIHTPVASGSFDQEGAYAYAPEVTLALSEIDVEYSDATMSFTTSNAQSVNSTFTFGNGSAATAKVGKAVEGSENWLGTSIDTYPKCYPAGRMTQNKLSLTYAGMHFEITLKNAIVIDQPQSPTVLKFVGIPDSYTGTKPAQVIGNGTTVTVTLPKLEAWNTTIQEPKDGTWSAYTSVGEVATVDGEKTKALSYTTWTESGNCGDTTYYTYQYFTWTKFQSSITAETDFYTQDKQVVQWIINGRTYNAGQTVQITGDGILAATAVVSDASEKTFVETKTETTYKYLYGYVAESKVTKTETAPDLTVNIIGTPGSTQNAALSSAKIASVSNADAATDKPGTNTTTDPALYSDFWP